MVRPPVAVGSTDEPNQGSTLGDRRQGAEAEKTHPQARGKAVRELDAMESELIDTLRTIRYNGSSTYHATPDPDAIRLIIDESLRKIGGAIQYLLQAQPSAILTSSKLTDDAAKLSSILFDGRDWQQHPIQCLDTLLGGPLATTDVVLQAYAAAAIHKWVFEEFDGTIKAIMSGRDRDVFNVLRKGRSSFSRGSRH